MWSAYFQIEMDILDALDDSKLLNSRHQKACPTPSSSLLLSSLELSDTQVYEP